MSNIELTPPTDWPSEAALIASVVLDPELLAFVDWVPETAFSLERHAAIWRAILKLWKQRARPDLVKIQAELRKSQELELIGGVSAISGVLASDCMQYDADKYAANVNAAYVRRQMLQVAGQIQAKACYSPDDLDTLIADTHAMLEKATRYANQQQERGIDEEINDWFKLATSGPNPGIPTGIPEFDTRFGGLQPRTLTLLGARPSIGKSSMAQQMALNMAVDGDLIVDFISIEMAKQELYNRMNAQYSGVPLTVISERTFMGNPDLMRRIAMSADAIRKSGLSVDDSKQTLTSLRSSILRRAAKRGRNPDVVIVDYLQKIKPPTNRREQNRSQDVNEISGGLKELAKELGCAVLAITGVSREAEKTPDKIPLLSHLREGGDLEYDGDLIIFMWRDIYEQNGDPSKAKLVIAKNRNGPLGVIDQQFNGATTSFRSVNNYKAPEGY